MLDFDIYSYQSISKLEIRLETHSLSLFLHTASVLVADTITKFDNSSWYLYHGPVSVLLKQNLLPPNWYFIFSKTCKKKGLLKWKLQCLSMQVWKQTSWQFESDQRNMNLIFLCLHYLSLQVIRRIKNGGQDGCFIHAIPNKIILWNVIYLFLLQLLVHFFEFCNFCFKFQGVSLRYQTIIVEEFQTCKPF